MSAPSTKSVFQAVIDALEGDLVPTYADVVERYDGDPWDAINEHVARFDGARGTSILVGFTSGDVSARTANQQPRQLRIPITVLIVRRRGGFGDHEADCEALDDAMDATRQAFEYAKRKPSELNAEGVIPVSVYGLKGADTWWARAVQVDLYVNNLP